MTIFEACNTQFDLINAGIRGLCARIEKLEKQAKGPTKSLGQIAMEGYYKYSKIPAPGWYSVQGLTRDSWEAAGQAVALACKESDHG